MLESHPKVSAAGVFGVPDVDHGEMCAALVVLTPGPDDGERVEEEELVDWVNSQVKEWRRLKSVRFVENIPHNTLGKKQRKRMKEMWENNYHILNNQIL